MLPPRRADDEGVPDGTCELLDAYALGDGETGDIGPDPWAAVVRLPDGSIVGTPLLRSGSGDLDVRRARPGDGVSAALLTRFADPGADASATAFSLHGVVADPPPASASERGFDVDQTHDSVVVADSVVVKWGVRLAPQEGQPPAVRLLRQLSSAGFTEMPTPRGHLLWRDLGSPESGGPTRLALLASAADYLPGAQDGWDWYVDDVLALLTGERDLGGVLEPATALGGLVARFHVALATPTESGSPTRSIARRLDHLAHWQAGALLGSTRPLSVTSGEEGERLRALADRAAAALDQLATIGSTPRTLVHGDLHVGQVLRWSGGYALNDFDGNPVLTSEEQRAKQPPARDVAGMLQSLDHVGRIASRRTQRRQDEEVERWIAGAKVAFLDAYRAGPAYSRTRRAPRRAAPAAVRRRAGVPRVRLRSPAPADLDPRTRPCPARPAERGPLMEPHGFLADVERSPETMLELATALDDDALGLGSLPTDVDRILLLGMGSSTYAAGVVAARLRAAGFDAVAELASSHLLPPATARTLVVAVSASGGSVETVDALTRYSGRSPVVAVTEQPDSPVAKAADVVVPLLAGPEEGGVACRSYRHTIAVLLALAERFAPSLDPRVPEMLRLAAAATADLLERRHAWLPAAADLVDGRDGSWVVGPAHRLASAQQSALMLREGPRRPSHACETGDWSHVDVYLTKTLDYRMLLLPGSTYEPELLRWTAERGSTVVSVGADVPGAGATIRYRHDEVDDVRLLTEVTVAELVAHRWWAAAS